MKCTVPKCARDAIARGWCPRHYQQERRTGDPIAHPIEAPRYIHVTIPAELNERLENIATKAGTNKAALVRDLLIISSCGDLTMAARASVKRT